MLPEAIVLNALQTRGLLVGQQSLPPVTCTFHCKRKREEKEEVPERKAPGPSSTG